MADELASVVRLHPELDLEDEDAPLHQADRPPFCRHDRVTIDVEAHELTCRTCDRRIDPLKYLDRLAGEWRQYVDARKAAASRANAEQQRLEETRRLEANARARLGRLRAKPELVPVYQADAMAQALRRLADARDRDYKRFARQALRNADVPLEGPVVDFGEELEP